MKKVVSFLGNELLLGLLITLLSVFTAWASYQGALADGNQNDFEIQGMASLNDGNVFYLEANQTWIQDDGNYDNWYINLDTNPDVAAYYEGNFTELLAGAIERNGADEYPIDDQYVTELYADATEQFEISDTSFETANDWNGRGDHLQLVLTIMAIGLAFAGWASINKEESNLRAFFSLLAIITLIFGLISYLATPIVG
ncbi:MAG: hypothetical protein HOP27_04315 [Anaerolineales bacterium]|nr:hypothetical protein [Anaerolineales bacterium]